MWKTGFWLIRVADMFRSERYALLDIRHSRIPSLKYRGILTLAGPDLQTVSASA